VICPPIDQLIDLLIIVIIQLVGQYSFNDLILLLLILLLWLLLQFMWLFFVVVVVIITVV